MVKMRIILKLILLLFISLQISCKTGDNSEKVEVKYYQNDRIETKKFIVDGEIKIQKFYDDENNNMEMEILMDNDSTKKLKFFDKNGSLTKEGVTINDNLVGIWKSYKDSIVSSLTEFILLDNKSYQNQNWVLSRNRDTVAGFFYETNYKHIVSPNEKLRFHFFLRQPYFPDNSKSYILIPKKGEFFNNDYSNRNRIGLDTIVSIGQKTNNYTQSTSFNHDIMIDVFSKTSGQYNFRGILVEELDSSEGKIESEEKRYFYFNLPYEVKD